MKKGFTLIELLVVIAIIAILAAILFPVFAQAKLAAKKTAALSNVKQLQLAVIMYDGDFDGQYPEAFQGTCWTGEDLLAQRLQPYVKSIGLFGMPVDAQAGKISTDGSWAGVGVSFAANSYYGNWCCSPTWSSGFQLRGPMGVGNSTNSPDACGGTSNEGAGWLMNSQLGESQITQPAATIALCEKNGADIEQWNQMYGSGNGCGTYNCTGNWSGFAMGALIGGTAIDVTNGVSGWGPMGVPNGQSTYWKTYGGANASPTMYEYGVNGAVSASYSGQSVFAYLDGHAKSMNPVATDPDLVNQPQNNQWDGLR